MDQVLTNDTAELPTNNSNISAVIANRETLLPLHQQYDSTTEVEATSIAVRSSNANPPCIPIIKDMPGIKGNPPVAVTITTLPPRSSKSFQPVGRYFESSSMTKQRTKQTFQRRKKRNNRRQRALQKQNETRWSVPASTGSAVALEVPTLTRNHQSVHSRTSSLFHTPLHQGIEPNIKVPSRTTDESATPLLPPPSQTTTNQSPSMPRRRRSPSPDDRQQHCATSNNYPASEITPSSSPSPSPTTSTARKSNLPRTILRKRWSDPHNIQLLSTIKNAIENIDATDPALNVHHHSRRHRSSLPLTTASILEKWKVTFEICDDDHDGHSDGDNGDATWPSHELSTPRFLKRNKSLPAHYSPQQQSSVSSDNMPSDAIGWSRNSNASNNGNNTVQRLLNEAIQLAIESPPGNFATRSHNAALRNGDKRRTYLG